MDVYSEEPIERSPHARRNAVIVVIVLVLVALLAWGLTRGGGETQGQGQGAAGGGRRGGAGGGNRGAATVGIAKVAALDMPETVSAIGTVTPVVTATVHSQVSGNIFAINFTEGQMVRKGQQLALIDPRPYKLALAQAEANLARDQAQLNLARVTLGRYQTLLKQDSIARQDVDTQAATAKQLEGTIGSDKAAVGTARLNLQYTSIPAPVSGRVGLRQVDIGNYVTPGDATGIVIITQTTPIDVVYSLPQSDLQRLLAKRAAGDPLSTTAKDQAGTATLAQGNFLTFDNQIDATTGTVKAKSRFPNPDSKLFPNQFVNVVLLADTLKNAATVPVTAVRHGVQGDFVFVVQPDHTVKLQTVKTGPGNGTVVAILSGLALGQTVVTEGADNLDDGSKVVLPGDCPPQFGGKKTGFFAGLFGGGEKKGGQRGGQTCQKTGGDATAPAGADGSGQHKHRRQQQGGQGQ
ncbi:multidrug efflux system membrane fusion protein [Sphingomonas vulcanisoli]|uniref:Multidrug efflux system membrane fusion protein n=1 Tax=Sphingomonas vulcanisoli TaxID=1658060 RepID=A0ABX0TU47_9SPHN|nr:MdtA/MuxA family multidrug efflux RND transporter periplasmic adaptor subunit [Sphingomonas vulcanisoli]NIJ07684.1 multidrug efflux system membrane fusion protein [Sphingomonas vulcanisoli]